MKLKVNKKLKAFMEKLFFAENVILGLIVGFGLGLLLELTGYYLLMLLAGGVAGFLVKSGWKSFLVGFTSIFLAWGIYFLYLIYETPFYELVELIIEFIGIDISPFIWVSLVIGAILGGIGGLIGAFTTQMIIGNRYKKRGKNKGRDENPITKDADKERINESFIEKPVD